jgi:hypothetical protein
VCVWRCRTTRSARDLVRAVVRARLANDVGRCVFGTNRAAVFDCRSRRAGDGQEAELFRRMVEQGVFFAEEGCATRWSGCTRWDCSSTTLQRFPCSPHRVKGVSGEAHALVHGEQRSVATTTGKSSKIWVQVEKSREDVGVAGAGAGCVRDRRQRRVRFLRCGAHDLRAQRADRATRSRTASTCSARTVRFWRERGDARRRDRGHGDGHMYVLHTDKYTNECRIGSNSSKCVCVGGGAESCSVRDKDAFGARAVFGGAE